MITPNNNSKQKSLRVLSQHQLRKTTSHSAMKQKLIILAFIFITTTASAEIIKFNNNPATLIPAHGNPIQVVEIDYDDEQGVLFYKDIFGKESFLSEHNVQNLEQLLSKNKKPTVKKRQPTTHTPTAKAYSYPPSSAPYDGMAKLTVNVLNSSYGNVCNAKIKGFFSKTLVINWTSRTNKLHAMKVMAEVGSVKDKLYQDGIRYFQFPNDSGTYNVIDWKTGERKSISDRTDYYFPN